MSSICVRISLSRSASGRGRKLSAAGVLGVSGNSLGIGRYSAQLRADNSPDISRRLRDYYDGITSVAPVRIAAGALEADAVMLAERADRIALARIRIGVAGPDDDRPEASVVLSARRQHRGGKRGAVHLAQCQEQRHLALDVRLEADLLLERHLRDRAEALRRPVLLLAKVFFDGVAHGFRFGDRLGLGLDAEPRLAARAIANVSHDSSQH